MDQKWLQSFYQGQCSDAYSYFGAHFCQQQNVPGVRFALLAPAARQVFLVGEFNQWDPQATPLIRNESGIWEVFVPGLSDFAMYKYHLQQADGSWADKADPYAFYTELRPGFAAKAVNDDYQWHDESWMKARTDCADKPLNIYECHLGGFKHKEDDSWYSYYEMIDQLLPYVKKMNFTHIELMPLNEYPLDGSWGYQQYGYFAVSSRYGSPYQLKMFIEACHKAGIGVIMDIVPVHFVTDSYGLVRFDGTALYESADPSRADSQWGTLYFDFTKPAVVSFLLSSAARWLDRFHIDGLRMDAVSNLIYYDGNKDKGFNSGGVNFIRQFNRLLHQRFKGIMTIAEDSSDYPHVTAPCQSDGLGFDYKWDLGWMNDTLNYYKMDPVFRQYHHNDLTFSMAYFWSERFILPLSHDEVVHSKATIIDKMWGSYEQKFAQCRNLMIYMYTHPGKKLSFMGNEIASFREFDENKELDWFLLKYPIHDSYFHFIQKLNRLYQTIPAFSKYDYNYRGFEWIDADNKDQQVYSYMRYDDTNCYLVVLNMAPSGYEKFDVGVPVGGSYTEIINSQQDIYSGTNQCNPHPLKARRGICHNRPYYLTIALAPFAGLIIKGRLPQPVTERKK